MSIYFSQVNAFYENVNIKYTSYRVVLKHISYYSIAK